MTGFARASGDHDGLSWNVELRSVNGKGLDVRTRLPSELSHLEQSLRGRVQKHFNRGNIQLSLSMQTREDTTAFRVNEALYAQLESFLTDRGDAPRPSDILALPGVISEQTEARSEEEQATLDSHILKTLDEAISKLSAARMDEGNALAPVMHAAIDGIEAQVLKAETLSATQPATLKSKLQERLNDLDLDHIDPDRLAQEVAILAQKADIREELDRLKAHIVQGRSLLDGTSPVGRKLDFLACLLYTSPSPRD